MNVLQNTLITIIFQWRAKLLQLCTHSPHPPTPAVTIFSAPEPHPHSTLQETRARLSALITPVSCGARISSVKWQVGLPVFQSHDQWSCRYSRSSPACVDFFSGFRILQQSSSESLRAQNVPWSLGHSHVGAIRGLFLHGNAPAGLRPAVSVRAGEGEQ